MKNINIMPILFVILCIAFAVLVVTGYYQIATVTGIAAILIGLTALLFK